MIVSIAFLFALAEVYEEVHSLYKGMVVLQRTWLANLARHTGIGRFSLIYERSKIHQKGPTMTKLARVAQNHYG